MPKLKDETRLERRSQITEAALRCFARNGFAGTSMADIIAESGLSAGSIYSHFDSKTELMQHVATETLSLPGALADDGFASPGAAMRTLARRVGMRPEFARILLQVWSEATRDEELRELARTNVRRVHGWFEDGLHEWADAHAVTPREAADVTLAAMQGYVARLALDPEVDQAQLLATITARLDA